MFFSREVIGSTLLCCIWHFVLVAREKKENKSQKTTKTPNLLEGNKYPSHPQTTNLSSHPECFE
ncbi:hypothetical protein GLYMA_06G053150v4 [Glycine max]|nr:hypothetical protein GLYMA_06G053150v4 [Glycine max]KAH1124285.1 hypothetical protein GYH30_014149 [Glycine max]